jgi:hypothetical protein
MSFSFRNLALLTSLICLSLAFIWLFFPNFLLSLWSVQYSYPVGLVGRRGAALFFCLAVIFYLSRNAEPSQARFSISIGFILGCAFLALLGIYELLTSNAGIGILSAAVVEIMLAVSFGILELKASKERDGL